MKTQFVFSLLFMLFCCIGIISTPMVISAEEITGTPDDTSGVFIFAAGTDETSPGACDGISAAEPTGFIVQDAINFGILDHVGDEPEEVLSFVVGDAGEIDITVDEIIMGLNAIDDFGDISNGGDDVANYDAGANGELQSGFRMPFQVIVADGIIADGVIGGPTAAGSYQEANENLGGMELFIFEDAELSGFELELYGPERSWIINIDDFQINPGTANGADDILIGIDLDNLPGWDGTFITDIRIVDDGIEQAPGDSCTGIGLSEQSLEVDAIVARGETLAFLGRISGNVSEDTDGDTIGDTPLTDVELSLLNETGNPVIDEAGNDIKTTSNAQGDYLFQDIFPGSYSIIQTQPDGYDDVGEADGGDDSDHVDNGVVNNIPTTVELDQEDTGNNFVEELAVPTSVTLNHQSSSEPITSLWVVILLGLALVSLSLVWRKSA